MRLPPVSRAHTNAHSLGVRRVDVSRRGPNTPVFAPITFSGANGWKLETRARLNGSTSNWVRLTGSEPLNSALIGQAFGVASSCSYVCRNMSRRIQIVSDRMKFGNKRVRAWQVTESQYRVIVSTNTYPTTCALDWLDLRERRLGIPPHFDF